MRPNWLKWIDPGDNRQLTWAAQYLSARGYSEFISGYGYQISGDVFIRTMERLGQDRAFLYTVDRMRAAWRQKRYRKANGQQVAFQLPDQVRKDLTRLAKARGMTKVEALRQLITEAAGQHNQEREVVKKVKEEREELKAEHEKETGIYRRAISHLLEILAEELHERYRLQALLGDLAGESLDDEMIGKYNALIAKRREEVKKALPGLKLMRLGPPGFDQRLHTLANKLHLGDSSVPCA